MNVILLYIYLTTAFVKEVVSKNATRPKPSVKYVAEPNWDILDKRPLPKWYDEAKIGIFIHWGLYSVPAFKSEWFWYFWRTGDGPIKEFTANNSFSSYFDFVPKFTAEKFEPDKWAELFAKAGARYVVLTSKHHDGFALFPSGRSNWNSVDVGPKTDIVGVLADSVRKYNLTFGVYYSLTEWYNKLLARDRKKDYQTTVYTDSVVWPDIKYLINTYKPSVLWCDGDWDGSDIYWKSRELLTWIYNESPVKDEIVVNDRWGNSTNCKHGDFYNCEDRFEPGYFIEHKWENAFTIDTESWGYRNIIKPNEILTIEAILEKLVATVSCGGNVLINIGPTKEGIISPIFKERLLQIGDWLKVNGEAIYNSSRYVYRQDPINKDAWYTTIWYDEDSYFRSRFKHVYTIFLKWPENNVLTLQGLSSYLKTGKNFTIQLLNNEGDTTSLKYRTYVLKETTKIRLPVFNNSSKRKYAWTLKTTKWD